jgi:UDP-N-acetylmuramate-alanine ligase
MSGISEILNSRGFEVSGSDRALTEVTQRLQDLGIKIYEAILAII